MKNIYDESRARPTAPRCEKRKKGATPEEALTPDVLLVRLQERKRERGNREYRLEVSKWRRKKRVTREETKELALARAKMEERR